MIVVGECNAPNFNGKTKKSLEMLLIDNSELGRVDSVSYLGITFTKISKFSEHVSNIACKAIRLLKLRGEIFELPQNV